MTDDGKELKDQRVVTMMSPSELEAIDDWMFKNRIRSRGEAIRRLCQIALVADEKGEAIFSLAESILKCRTKEAQFTDQALKASSSEMPTGIFKLITVQNALDALADHARLFLALRGLFSPLGMMRDTTDINEALRFAESARSGLDEIAKDREIVEKALEKFPRLAGTDADQEE